jgi:phosphoadenosine phosphosulfate reductase
MSTSLMSPTPSELSLELASLKTPERFARLFEIYGARAVATTSFGLQAAVTLHLIHHHAPKMPVVFIDTGYLFPETYQYIEQLLEKWPVDLRTYTPLMTAARQEVIYGKLWEQGKEGNEKYALINKIEPMNRALKDLAADVWISGLRRSQSSTRVHRPFAEQQNKTLKVYPILDWPDAQVNSYMAMHQIPPHPLSSSYVTMGDWHSTAAAEQGVEAEATRYNGEKYECGLHEQSNQSDFQI